MFDCRKECVAYECARVRTGPGVRGQLHLARFGRHAMRSSSIRATPRPCEAYLAKRGWRLTAILLTHHHHDHVGGVSLLCRTARRVPVYGPAGEAIEHLTHASRKMAIAVTHRAPGARISRARRAGPHERPHRVFSGGRPARHAASSFAATRCSRAAAAGCSKARRSRCSRRSTRSPRCPERHAGALRARVHAVEHPLRARLRAGQRRNCARWRDDATDAARARHGRRCRRPSRHERAVNPFLRADDSGDSGDACSSSCTTRFRPT